MYVDWAKPPSMDASASQKDLSPVCHGHHDSEWSGLHPAALNPEQTPPLVLRGFGNPAPLSEAKAKDGMAFLASGVVKAPLRRSTNIERSMQFLFEIGHNNEICKPFRDEL